MSTIIVDLDELTKVLQGVRLAVDSALRVLGDKGTPPPLPPSRPADVVLGSAPKTHEHQWVAAGFGSAGKSCHLCGAKG